MRAELGTIALRLVQQDARLSRVEARAKQLQQFSESIQPKEPETYREVIRESARETGRSADEIARDLGFTSFDEVPVEMNNFGELPPGYTSPQFQSPQSTEPTQPTTANYSSIGGYSMMYGFVGQIIEG